MSQRLELIFGVGLAIVGGFVGAIIGGIVGMKSGDRSESDQDSSGGRDGVAADAGFHAHTWCAWPLSQGEKAMAHTGLKRSSASSSMADS